MTAITIQQLKIAALAAEKGSITSRDAALAFKTTPSNVNNPLQSAVRNGLLSVSRKQIPYVYTAKPGWEKIKQTRVDYRERMKSVNTARHSRESRACVNHCHLDTPSATAHLNNVWGWVRPARRVAA